MPKILQLHELIGPAGLSLDDVPLIEPEADEIRVKVISFALNWGDMDFMAGNYTVNLESLPARVGGEVVGIVDAVGANLSPELIGQRVCSLPYFHAVDRGMSGEFALIHKDYFVPASERLNNIEACAVWGQYVTAYFPLIEYGKIGKDSVVLITAATGTAGIGGLKMAKYCGATTICTSRKKENRDFLLAQGADHVVIPGEEGIAERIDQITDGKGANLVYDPVGGELMSRYAPALAQDAQIILYGGLSGQLTVLPELELTAKNAVIRFYSVQIHTADVERVKRAADFIKKGIDSGHLTPLIDRCFTLENYKDAFDYMQSQRSSHGKIVVETGLTD